jgi:hypothetical protein
MCSTPRSFVALLLVRRDHCPNLGKDLCSKMLTRNFFAEFDQLPLGHAFEITDRGHERIPEAADVQQVAGDHVTEIEELLAADLTVLQALKEHVPDRVCRYDGAVEIEERRGRLATQTCGNFPREVFIGLHWAVSVCRFGCPQGRKFTMTETGVAFNT